MLREQKGIHSVKVALLAERGVIEFDPHDWSVVKLISVCAVSPLSHHVSFNVSIRKYQMLVSMLP